jgi:hypothetical protein
MDSIYSNASLTIVVADSESAGHGIPGISSKREPPTAIFIHEGLKYTIRQMLDNYVSKSVWKSRAWTFQEHLFSRRFLIFTGHACYFRCPNFSQRDDYEQSVYAGKMQEYPLHSRFPHILSEQRGRGIDRYFSMVQDFSSRRLTRPNDVLNAFSGIMTALNRELWAFVQGLPRRHFVHALTWSAKADYSSPPQRRDGFPSWTWAGWIFNTSSSIDFVRDSFSRQVLAFHILGDNIVESVNATKKMLVSNHTSFLPF